MLQGAWIERRVEHRFSGAHLQHVWVCTSGHCKREDGTCHTQQQATQHTSARQAPSRAVGSPPQDRNVNAEREAHLHAHAPGRLSGGWVAVPRYRTTVLMLPITWPKLGLMSPLVLYRLYGQSETGVVPLHSPWVLLAPASRLTYLMGQG